MKNKNSVTKLIKKKMSCSEFGFMDNGIRIFSQEILDIYGSINHVRDRPWIEVTLIFYPGGKIRRILSTKLARGKPIEVMMRISIPDHGKIKVFFSVIWEINFHEHGYVEVSNNFETEEISKSQFNRMSVSTLLTKLWEYEKKPLTNKVIS